VTPALEGLRQHDPHHHYYPPEAMHVTVRKLGRFPSDDPGVVARLAELRHIAASHPSFDLTMWGLNLSPTTVFAQNSSARPDFSLASPAPRRDGGPKRLPVEQ
jgi:2'-5' RNA ligase